MQRPAGYWYIFVLCVIGLVISINIVSFDITFMFNIDHRLRMELPLFMLDGGYFLLTLLRMNKGKGYWLAFAAPFAALPIWGILVAVLAGIKDLLAHGLEGSHTTPPAEYAGYIISTSLVVLPFWLIFHIPYWLIMLRTDVRQALQY